MSQSSLPCRGSLPARACGASDPCGKAVERGLWALGGIRSVGVRAGTALIVFEDGGEISIGTSRAFTSDPRSPDTVRGTSVALESSAEILAKKIGGRILRNNTFVPRDLYDLVMARHFEPAALDRAVRCFTLELLQQIADELRHLPVDWMDTHPVPVVAPSNPVAAQQAPRTVRMMLDQPRRRR